MHDPVPGLEDLPHAAGAEPFQDEEWTEDEIVAVAAKELIGLIRRDRAGIDELQGQGIGVWARLGQRFPYP